MPTKKRDSDSPKPANVATKARPGMPNRSADGTWSVGNALRFALDHGRQGGRTRIVTPERIIDAVESMETAGQPITWAGVALAVGVSRPTLDEYLRGTLGADDPAIRTTLRGVRTLIESDLEGELRRKTGQTGGIVFALKNQAGWRDERHLAVESQENQTLSVTVDPQLAAMLRRPAPLEQHDNSTLIDGECTQVIDSKEETDW